MTKLNKIAFAGVFIALMLGAQFVLSGVAGVEVVTPLLLSYCLYFGVKQGLLVASGFSLLRCLIFGFSPTAIILYLIYYNLFALLFGFLGHKCCRPPRVWQYVVLTCSAVGCTVLFTLLDDVISPIFLGLSIPQAQVYFLASLPTMGIQCLCTLLTVPLLVPPLMETYIHLPLTKKI